MGTRAPHNQDDLMGRDLNILKEYAERVIVHGDVLTNSEEDDRKARFRNFAEIGDSFSLTERDMVSMLFEGLFHQGPKCWCAECRSNDEA